VLLGLLVLTCLPELLLTAADWGLAGSARWRPEAYQYGAFWAGLLHGWRPNYAGQPALMFVSYAFLHGGLAHLAGNMLVLLSFGAAGFLAAYLASAIGGGLAFGLISDSIRPMVGASGALFGLAGALVAWDGLDRRAEGRPLWPVWRAVLGYMGLNLALWAALSGQLAWETLSVGGFFTGAASAALLARLRGI